MSQGNVRGKRQSHMNAGAFGERAVEVEKHSASAYILGLGEQFVNTGVPQFDGCGQAHIEAPHEPPVVRFFRHCRFSSFEHSRFPSVTEITLQFQETHLSLTLTLKILNCQQFARSKGWRELTRLMRRSNDLTAMVTP